MTNNKIPIVFVITGLGTGGAEMMLYKMLTRLNRERFSPSVIALLPGGVFDARIRELDIPVYDLGMREGMPSLSAFRKLGELFKEIKPEIIQGWMYHGNFVSTVANAIYRRKAFVFWSIHHSVASISAEKKSLAAMIKITAKLSKSVQAVVFSAQRGQQQHIEIGYNSTNSVAISDNFDLKNYQPGVGVLDIRGSLSLPGDAILVGSVAGYRPMKDHTGLVSAAALVVRECPNVHFVLIGPGVDSNNVTLTSQIQALGVQNRIHLLGERQDIPEVLGELDIFTSGSAYGESFPNVLGEAMACGVPCVATDVGDSAVILGEFGVVVPPSDPEALASGWRQLLDLNDSARKLLGQQARQRIETAFNLDGSHSFVRQYESLYEKALATST